MLLYVLISFPFIWLAVAALVAAACRMAAQADRELARAQSGGLEESGAPSTQPARAQTGVRGLRLAGWPISDRSRRLPTASA